VGNSDARNLQPVSLFLLSGRFLSWNQLIKKGLRKKVFGIEAATICSMTLTLTFLNSLPEPGGLALIGLSLIIAAYVLRKSLIRVHPDLDATSKAEAQPK